jgi:hypothetical protein
MDGPVAAARAAVESDDLDGWGDLDDGEAAAGEAAAGKAAPAKGGKEGES